MRGITDNCAPGNYCPSGTLTRERIAFLLVRVFNMPLTNLPPSLAEVDSVEDLPAPAGAKVLASPLQTFTKTVSFIYNADGQRVAQTINGVTTYFVGGHYEKTGAVVTKYYFAGSQRVAMRKNGVLSYFVNDHLGSTSLMTDANGNATAEMRYTPWGKVRYSGGAMPTNYTYTGQYSNTADFGLMYYNARWYDPGISKFTQPDTIIPNPGNSLDWNRYSYARYNPLKYTDPSGHEVCLEDGYCGKYFSKDHLKYLTRKYGVIFKNDWTEDVMWAIMEGVQAVGQKFSEGMGVDAAVAFRQVYGIEGNDKFIFESGCPASECSAFGRTYGSRHVKFRDFYKSNFRNVTLAVHELAHAFENVLEITLPDGKKYKPARESLPDNLFSSRDGLADEPGWTWQHSEDINRGEIFADMFVGWVFDKWANPLVSDLAGERAEWMSKNMPTFYK